MNVYKTMEYIKELCLIPSPTGFTHEAAEFLKKKFTDMEFNPVSTVKGSVLVELGGEGNPIVLSAHIDTLGAMVRAVKPNGRLRLTKIGGYPENNIEAENCMIHTRDGRTYSGCIQLTHSSVHVYNDIRTMERNDTNIEVVIDEKVNNKDDVKALGIKAGDFISLDPRTIITDSGFIKSRHLDDKASAGMLIHLAELIKSGELNLSRKTYVLFTTYEEVGHGASAGLPEDITEILAVDMGCVGDDLETDEFKVSICAKDSSTPYDYDVTTKLIEICEKHGLNYAVDVYPYYGSDAGAALRSGRDIKFGLIGTGVASSHGYERTHREGIENTLKLIIEYLK